MTDNYLVKKISVKYPFMESIYKNTSGYVHLSEKHIFNSLGNLEKECFAQMKVSRSDEFIKEEDYLEAINAFLEITGILFSYLNGWSLTKKGKFK